MKHGIGSKGVTPKPLGIQAECLVEGVGRPYIAPDRLTSPPIAPSNRIFLPQAIAYVGRSTQHDWKNWEVITMHYPSPAPVPSLTVEKYLSAQRPPQIAPFTIANPDPRAVLRREKYEKEMDAWIRGAPERVRKAEDAVRSANEYCETWRTGISEHEPGVVAIRRAYDLLVVAVMDEIIAVYFRPQKGGELKQLKPSILTDPSFSENAIRHGSYTHNGFSYYLFADRVALESYFHLKPETPDVGGVSVDELSSYLQLALYVHAQGFGPSFTGGKKAVRKALAEAAVKFGITLSPTQEDYLATFLRNKDVQGGKNPNFEG